MKALTLHRPWPWAILHLDAPRAKRIENRSWPPPESLVGQFFAIHAGLTYDEDGAAFIRRAAGIEPPPEHEHPTGLVGVARLVGVREPFPPWRRASDCPSCGRRVRITGGVIARHTAPGTRRRCAGDAWYMGKFGWLLGDVHVLPQPIACRGAQQLWVVPAREAALVREQLPPEVARCV